MKRIDADWIANTDTQAVCHMLTDAGFDCYFVGGCVRNVLLGAPVNDIDISTNARPARIMELAKLAGLKAVPTGIDHGTVTVISSGVPFEITTYRRDIETDGRRAVVAFADTIEEDARRRDFTMNALYANQDGEVVDPLNGFSDLMARRVRFIEDADLRIKEDYLRILRFFRFHAWYGDESAGLDSEGLAAIASNSGGLETVSKERIGSEVLKLLSAPSPAPSIAAMGASGVLSAILPGADAKHLSILVHFEADTKPNPIRRLAAIGGADTDDFLRLSKSQTRQLQKLKDETGSTRSPAELGYRLGVEMAYDVILLRAALLEMPLNPEELRQIETGAAAKYPIKADDLMPEFQGAKLGQTLADLEAKWIKSGFALTKEQLLD